MSEAKPIPTIYLCKKCGEEIPRATQYQILQDYCRTCFKARHKRSVQIKLELYL